MFFSKTIHPQEIQKKLSLKSKKSRKLQKIGGKSWYTTRFDMILPLGSSGPMFFSGKNRLFCKRAVFTQIQFFISWWCRTVRRKSRNVRRAKDLRMEAGTCLGNAKLERLKFKNGKRLMLAIKNGDFTISHNGYVTNDDLVGRLNDVPVFIFPMMMVSIDEHIFQVWNQQPDW